MSSSGKSRKTKRVPKSLIPARVSPEETERRIALRDEELHRSIVQENTVEEPIYAEPATPVRPGTPQVNSLVPPVHIPDRNLITPDMMVRNPPAPLLYGEVGKVVNVLTKNNFTPLETIVVNGTAKYILVSSPTGALALMELDEPDFLPKNSSTDHTYVMSEDGIPLPSSIKQGSLSCVGNDCSGVAIRCNDEYCVVNRNGESTFTPEQRSVASGARSLVSYPLIKFSDLRKSPKDVIIAIDEVTNRMRKGVTRIVAEDARRAKDEFINLINAYKEFYQTQEETVRHIQASIEVFEKNIERHFKDKVLVGTSLELFRNAIRNIEARSKMLMDVMARTRLIADHARVFRDLANKTRDATQQLVMLNESAEQFVE